VSKLAIVALTTSVLLIFGALRVTDLAWSRAQTLTAAEARASNLAVILSEYVRESFAAGDASLRQLALHGRRVGGSSAPDSEWAPSLASAKAGLAGVGSISVTDARGTIRHSTLPAIVGQSRHDRFVFRQLAGPGPDDLVIDTPYLSIGEPRQFFIPAGRRLTTADGRFDGIVVAAFSPAAPRRFVKSVGVGRRGVVSVFHSDGVVLFREPSASNPLGEVAADDPVFKAAQRAAPSGTVRASLLRDGPVMLTAFQTTTTPPLIVAVSLEQDEVLADWQHQARGSALLFAALALTLAGALLVLFRQMSAKAIAEGALADAQQREAVRLREVNDRLAVALESEQHARRELEAASTLKDEFLMTLSHELRTPLTAICGWAHMLAAGGLDDRKRQVAAETIERNARAQMHLTDDLLDVSHAISGKLRLDLRMVNVTDLLRDAVDTIQPAADAKGIQIAIEPGAVSGALVADPDRLQQVVWNLLSNAIKFTPSGGQVRIDLQQRGNELELAVTDTGVGIAPDFLPHVFERFRQAEGGSTRRFGGLGLGLAIVRHIVELHGGSVQAESRGENQGATFRVRLPMKRVD
jgi:signal transduction histidine kinase